MVQPAGAGYYELYISSRIDALRDIYIRQHVNGNTVINYEDPDGAGPRAARRDIVGYTQGRLRHSNKTDLSDSSKS